MANRSFLYHHKIFKFQKIKATTKVWKVQIELPCGFYLIKNEAHLETIKWNIWQLLN